MASTCLQLTLTIPIGIFIFLRRLKRHNIIVFYLVLLISTDILYTRTTTVSRLGMDLVIDNRLLVLTMSANWVVRTRIKGLGTAEKPKAWYREPKTRPLELESLFYYRYRFYFISFRQYNWGKVDNLWNSMYHLVCLH